jgi:threonine/homoserine/homoserine lactone efflux protein
LVPTYSHLLAFAITALVIIVIPGPSVLFTVGRALSYGRREALLTVLGNGLGAAAVAAVVAVGLGAIVAASAVVLTVIKLGGAAYLIYLGVQAFRERRSLVEALRAKPEPARTKRVLWQGFLVGVTNPKTVVFFGAVMPQFADATRPVVPQLLIFGTIFFVLALASDSVWALVAGAARSWFARSPRRLEMIGGTGGLMIIGLGATVAITGSKE